MALCQDHWREREKRAAFYERQEARNAELVADGRADEVKVRDYTGKPTFYRPDLHLAQDRAASASCSPRWSRCRSASSAACRRRSTPALNPLVQIFKPVSPLAWLPIVTMVVSAVYHQRRSGASPRASSISAITVTLCSLWPTLINTALGVASIDKDLLNVGRVLQLSAWTQAHQAGAALGAAADLHRHAPVARASAGWC